MSSAKGTKAGTITAPNQRCTDGLVAVGRPGQRSPPPLTEALCQPPPPPTRHGMWAGSSSSQRRRARLRVTELDLQEPVEVRIGIACGPIYTGPRGLLCSGLIELPSYRSPRDRRPGYPRADCVCGAEVPFL